MKRFAFLWMVLVVLAFQVGLFTQAQAEVAGRLTLVEGRVDLLKGGKLPANPVKVNDEVQPGDVIRTKSLSKAQVTFIDKSTLTISPESRVAIEAYMFDPAKEKRSAVIQLFRGLAHLVVSKVYKVAEPDFVVKTNTAIMGVRGTEFGIRLNPNSSTVLNLEGVLQVGNIFPEVGQLFQRAFQVAYAFGPGHGNNHHWVILQKSQGTTVFSNLPPTIVFHFDKKDWEGFLQQMSIGPPICRRSDGVMSTCQSAGGGASAGTASGTLAESTGGGGTGSGIGSQPPAGGTGTTNTIVSTPPPVVQQQLAAPVTVTSTPTTSTKPPAHSGKR
jgi:hypothetical protein